MECLLNLVPLFLPCPESLSGNPKLKGILGTILGADQTYFKMAKDLILTDFPGPVMKEFANLITKQLSLFSRYGLCDKRPILELWLKTFIGLPNWSKDKNVLFVIDILCQEAFFHHESKSFVKSLFAGIYEVTN